MDTDARLSRREEGHNAPVFPEVFKREAVDRVISCGLPVGKVARELGLNEPVLRRWVMRL